MLDRNWLNQIARAILSETSNASGHKLDERDLAAAAAKIASIVGIAINEASREAERAKDKDFARLISAVVEGAGGEVVIDPRLDPLPCRKIKSSDGLIVFRTVRDPSRER